MLNASPLINLPWQCGCEGQADPSSPWGAAKGEGCQKSRHLQLCLSFFLLATSTGFRRAAPWPSAAWRLRGSRGFWAGASKGLGWRWSLRLSPTQIARPTAIPQLNAVLQWSHKPFRVWPTHSSFPTTTDLTVLLLPHPSILHPWKALT